MPSSRKSPIGGVMKHILLALVLLFSVSGVVTAGDYEGGNVAYIRGDYATAFEKLTQAAEAGDTQAQFNLGVMYGDGLGVPQDDQQAASWFRKAAEAGHTKAQVLLGLSYQTGQGVHKDIVQAHKWLNIASAYERSKEEKKWAVEARDSLASKMSPQQIAEAQKLAREWKPVK